MYNNYQSPKFVKSNRTIISVISEMVEQTQYDKERTVILRKNILAFIKYYIPHIADTSVDTVRNYLTKAGYLKAGNKNGQYFKIKNIPRNLTNSELRNQAYPNKH